jgi:hypothetical protein
LEIGAGSREKDMVMTGHKRCGEPAMLSQSRHREWSMMWSRSARGPEGAWMSQQGLRMTVEALKCSGRAGGNVAGYS